MMFFRMILCASVLMMLSGVYAAGEEQQAAKTSKDATKASEKTTEQSAENQDSSTAETAKQPTSDEADAKKEKAADEPAEREVDGVKLAAIEANIVSYTNEERARYGLEPFKVDKELMETAREHAAWMTRTRNMIHTARAIAENIAMGQPHSSDVVRAWMNSPGHRANILNSGHQRIGVAAYRTEEGTIFWCQQFSQ